MLPTTGETSHQYLATIRVQCSTFVEIELLFLLQETVCNYNTTQVSPYDPKKLTMFSILRPEDDFITNCRENFQKFVSFDEILDFLGEVNIVNMVLLSTVKLRQNSEKINRERNYTSRSCEKPIFILSSDQHHCSIDQQHITNIFLIPYNLWDMDPSSLVSLNHTDDKHSMSS